MKKIEINSEDLEMMNYNDVAFIILEKLGKKTKIVDLFNQVCDVLNLTNGEAESHIGDFFELLSTDKRFIMLDGGYWDLKIKHNKGMVTFDDEEEEEIVDENSEVEEENHDDYIDEDNSDDDTVEDDLAGLVIIDDQDDENN